MEIYANNTKSMKLGCEVEEIKHINVYFGSKEMYKNIGQSKQSVVE
jgi:hypothetical protein